MSREKAVTLKTYFETGDIPTQSEYASLIDSTVLDFYRGTDNASTSSAYTLTFTPPYTNLLNLVLLVQFSKNNTGYSTLKVDNLASVNITKNGGLPIITNDIKEKNIYLLAYDNESSTFEIVGNIPNQNTLYGNYAQTVQSATISGTTETSIIGSGVGSLSIPADFFKVGDSFHAKIGGVINGSNNNDEITVRIKAGGVILASTGSFILDQTTNNGWECELDFTVAVVGASGTICTNGNFAYTKNTDKKVQGYVFQDIQTLDTTVINTLDITVQFDNTNTDIYSANFVLYKTY
jgi:hypothetical protein